MCFSCNARSVSRRLAGVLLALFLLSAAVQPPSVSAQETAAHPLYCGPSTQAAVAAYFSDGDTVKILEHTNASWTRIVLEDGTIGYCDSELLSIRSGEAHSKSGIVIGETLRAVSVLSAADADATATGKLAAKVRVALLSDPVDGEYVQISVRGRMTGYVPANAIQLVHAELATVCTRPVLSATGAKTEAEACEKLRALSVYFEDGRYWNSASSGTPWREETFSVTDIPCAHTSSGYGYCNTYSGKTEDAFPEYGTETQCLGYASLLSDLVFGTDAPITIHYDLSRVRVGDHIRLVYWEHSMIVTETGTQADGTRYIRVTEVNADYESCQIQWNRLITENELYALGDVIRILTRYESEE